MQVRRRKRQPREPPSNLQKMNPSQWSPDRRCENRTRFTSREWSRWHMPKLSARTACKRSWRKVCFRHGHPFACINTAPIWVWQQANCRGRSYQFSSRDYPTGEGYSDPLHNVAWLSYLKFSYRIIPQRLIRTGWHLSAGAKSGRNFCHETGKTRDIIFVTGGKEGGNSLYENRSVVQNCSKSATVMLAV